MGDRHGWRAGDVPAAPVPGLSVLAERVRRLATQNDPDVLRAEFASIAAELEALASPGPITAPATRERGLTLWHSSPPVKGRIAIVARTLP